MQQSAYDDYDREWSFDPTCEIRLLRLERDITKQQHWSLAAPLNVYIKNIRTPSSNFAAISYEWGASEELAPCTIDGGEAAVRLNLLDLLKALPMLQEMRNLPKLFWIDSICINQANSEEKMHQIRLLKHVYSYAQCVLSWLSPTADFSNRAFIYVDRDVGDRSDAALVDALLNRRYWTRIWMVQEVVLGAQWWITSGLNIVDGDKLIHLFGSPSVLMAKHVCRWKQSKAYRLLQERNDRNVHGPSSLVTLMLNFHQLDSKFTVDKIRALLALCREDESIRDVHYALADIADEQTPERERERDLAEQSLYQSLVHLAQQSAPGCEVRSEDYVAFFSELLSKDDGARTQLKLQYIAARIKASRLTMPTDGFDVSLSRRRAEATPPSMRLDRDDQAYTDRNYGRRSSTASSIMTTTTRYTAIDNWRGTSPYLPSSLRSRVEIGRYRSGKAGPTRSGILQPQLGMISAPQFLDTFAGPSNLHARERINPWDTRARELDELENPRPCYIRERVFDDARNMRARELEDPWDRRARVSDDCPNIRKRVFDNPQDKRERELEDLPNIRERELDNPRNMRARELEDPRNMRARGLKDPWDRSRFR